MPPPFTPQNHASLNWRPSLCRARLGKQGRQPYGRRQDTEESHIRNLEERDRRPQPPAIAGSSL